MSKLVFQIWTLIITVMATFTLSFSGASHLYFAIIAIAAVFAILSIGGK